MRKKEKKGRRKEKERRARARTRARTRNEKGMRKEEECDGVGLLSFLVYIHTYIHTFIRALRCDTSKKIPNCLADSNPKKKKHNEEKTERKRNE